VTRFALAVLIGSPLIVGSAQVFQSKSPPEGPKIRIAVTGQKFCLGQPGFASQENQPPNAVTLRFHASLYYRNDLPKTLILPIIRDIAVIVSRSQTDLSHRANQLTRRSSPKREPPDLEGGLDLTSPAPEFFEMVPAGEEKRSRLDEYVVLRVDSPAVGRNQVQLMGSTIFLQLELDYLQMPKRLANELELRWREFGELWTGRVRTEPIQVSIPMSPAFADCSHEYRID
jgi:hypothetical protein